MTETAAQTGGCQCGAVRYRAEGELGYPHICHCRMCQKAAGNYFLPLAAAKRQDFELTRGEPKWFRSSDLVHAVKPVMQSSTDRKMSWFHALDRLPVEPQPETPDRENAIAASNHQHPDHDTNSWPPGESP
ncbi:GFA family protein [Rhizobium lentis]|uniref:GFA family protein n=1 Tax=Rhizobium lentis TaxID=1138194 RepID=UPI001C83EEE5|nr:GFA family protein [Rhizobium lentis]MBX5009866.1 GFA family protein [Rhizobium lentis]